MAMQEIGIKLRADTADAVKSVKDLERQMQGLDSKKSRGQDDNGFISEEDVKRFQRIAEDAEKVYQDFFERFNRVQRDFESKKQELERATISNAGSSTVNELKKQIADLEGRKALIQAQTQNVSPMRRSEYQQQQAQGTGGGDNSGGGGSLIVGAGKNLAGMMAGMLAIGQLTKMAREGMNLVKTEEANMMGLGQRSGGYAGDFQTGREDAYKAGKDTGYTSQESMQTAETLTRLGGISSKENMWKNTADLQMGARTMGVDVNQLAGSAGQLQKIGALPDGDMKKFADVLTSAINDSNMVGRDSEMIDAITGLGGQVGSGQLSLSSAELQNMIGLQTAMGSAEFGFKGQKGADMLGQMDGVVKGGGDNRLDLLLGWGTEFQGIEGRAELERMKGQGITDPEVRKRIMGNLEGVAGGDKDYQSLMLKDIFGISMQESDRLVQDDMKDMWKDPNLGADMAKGGAKTNEKRSKEVMESEAMRREQIDTKIEETKRYAGEGADSIWRPIQDAFTSQPEALQWAELGLGAGGVGAAGAIGTGKLIDKFKGKSPKAAPAAGTRAAKAATTKAAKTAATKGTMLKGASRLAPPAAFLGAADMASKAGDGFGDWLFGHEKGQDKLKTGIFQNPLTGPFDGKYEDDKQGALSKGWDWVTGANNKASAAELEDPVQSKSKVKKASASQATSVTSKGQEDNLQFEKINLDLRQALIEQEYTLLGEQRKNTEEMMKMLGVNSSTEAMNSQSGGGGGIFGALKNMLTGGSSGGGGISGFISGMFDGGGESAGGSNYKAVGKNSDFMNQNLKQQSSLSAEDIDKWISSKAKKGSVMLGQGDAFMKASKESGLDPRYLVAHAAHETGWGSSNIAKKKGNMYGIGAFDNSPMASAYKYDGAEGGIVEGAKWIAKNYTDKGQDTLGKMRHNPGGKEYATDPAWDDKIANIMAGSPSGGTQKVAIEITGDVKNMEKKDSNRIATAIVNSSKTKGVNLSFETRQGVGGNRA